MRIDLETNEGIGRRCGAALLGVPILGRAGAELSAHRRAQVGLAAAERQPGQPQRPRAGGARTTGTSRRTATPPSRRACEPRRGAVAAAEFRYLEPSDCGAVELRSCCPMTASADRSRYALRCRSRRRAAGDVLRASCGCCACRTTTTGRTSRARSRALTPRLLQTDLPASIAAVRQLVDLRAGAALAGAADRGPDDADRRAVRAQRRRWARATPAPLARRLRARLETEVNRFADPDDRYLAARQTAGAGTRWAASPGRSARPAGGDAEARRSTRRATRSTSRWPTAARSASRVMPTFSIDSGVVFERDTAGSAAPCARRSSRACSTSTRRSASRTRCRTSTRRRRISTRFGLHRERVLGHRPRLRRAPDHRRRHLARARSRHRRRDAAPGHRAALSASATSASRPTACR